MALKRDWLPSPNYSSRGGAGVRLVIVHTAEGALTYQALGNYFASGSAGVSSHVGIDDTPGRIGEYVKRPDKAWTAGDANPIAIQAELCGFASWGPDDWADHPAMLDNLARWIAEECKHYGIPIRKLSSAQAGWDAGVCGHVDVSGPGGHWDPGENLPWGKVIEAAKSGGPVYGPPPPEPAPLALPLHAIGADAMPPEYVVHIIDGDYFAFFASGLVRKVSNHERNAWGAGDAGGVPLIQAEVNNEIQTRWLDYDNAVRGLVKERK
jgi:hypothetical protein